MLDTPSFSSASGYKDSSSHPSSLPRSPSTATGFGFIDKKNKPFIACWQVFVTTTTRDKSIATAKISVHRNSYVHSPFLALSFL